MLYNAVFLEVMLNYRKCCENMTRRHTGLRAFLDSLQAQDLTKTSKNNTSRKLPISLRQEREAGESEGGRERALSR